MNKSKSVTKITFIVLLTALFFGIVFNVMGGYDKKYIDNTGAYLTNTGAIMGVITLGGYQLKIVQGENDCTEKGIELGTNSIATDKSYAVENVYLQNTDTGSDLNCYVRWKFTATIDGVEDIDINESCSTSIPNAFLNREDGYFYYVDKNNSYTPMTLASSNAVLLFDQMQFKGEYDAKTDTYGSILDQYYSGSNIKLNLVVQASKTAWIINPPTAKFIVQGNTISESLDFTNPYTLTIPTGYETITVDDETLYFQCWTRNGSGMFMPGNTVQLEEYDEFEAVYSAEESAISATTLAYTPTEDGTYAITGLNSNMVLDDGNLVISNFSEDQEITVIEDNAFSNVKTISTVSAQNSSITTIGSYAFYNCTNINTVTLPETVTNIGGYSFGDCINLQKIVLPECLETIGTYAFEDCRSLEEIVIPDGVKTISVAAFAHCTNLKTIRLPASLTEITDSVFNGCTSLTSIYIPANVTSLGWDAFTNCTSLTKFEIEPENQYFTSEDGVLYNKSKTQIKSYPSASGVYIVPEYVTIIEAYAFSGCSNLTSITIHKNVTYVGISAFERCTSLTEIIVDTNNTNYLGENGILYNKDKTVLEQWPSASGVVTIPETVTTIGVRAFYFNYNITEVVIGDNVTFIEDNNFCFTIYLKRVVIGSNVNKIGTRCFEHAIALSEIVFEDPTGWWITTNSNYTGGSVIDESNLTDSTYASTYCTNYKSYYWYKVD